MSHSILVAGTGKMARNIGLFFLEKGNRICWFSRDEHRLADLKTYVEKQVKRITKNNETTILNPEFQSFEKCEENSEFEVCIETIEESLDAKKKLIDFLIQKYSIKNLFTNSSSIVPSRIHPLCRGLHFFYPIQLHPCAEVITSDVEHCNEIVSLLKANQITPIVEDYRRAFVVNRLLLPIQTESIIFLKKGMPAEVIDFCTTSPLLAMGQIRMMESIGSNVLCNALENYKEIVSDFEGRHLNNLIEEIHNFNDSSHYKGVDKICELELKKHFLYLFINTCLYFIERKSIEKEQLSIILESIFGAEEDINSIIKHHGHDVIREYLLRSFEKYGRIYFMPSKLLE